MNMLKLTVAISMLIGSVQLGAQQAPQTIANSDTQRVVYEFEIVESNQKGVVSKQKHVLVAFDGRTTELPICAPKEYPMVCDANSFHGDVKGRKFLVRVTPSIGLRSISSDVFIASTEHFPEAIAVPIASSAVSTRQVIEKRFSTSYSIQAGDGVSTVLPFGEVLQTLEQVGHDPKHRYALGVTARVL